ncbi:Mitogen-activated protein kinase-binding protein 1 [Gonapodya sp. JEL0774]|nr:Mitogen-activated protein kinase-binding protein 1 [Gonapodya sp. JEL0774]
MRRPQSPASPSPPPHSLTLDSPNTLPDLHHIYLERIIGSSISDSLSIAAHPSLPLFAYPAGRALVLYNYKKHKQSFLIDQDRPNEIASVAFDPEGLVVAVGEKGPNPIKELARVKDVLSLRRLRYRHSSHTLHPGIPPYLSLTIPNPTLPQPQPRILIWSLSTRSPACPPLYPASPSHSRTTSASLSASTGTSSRGSRKPAASMKALAFAADSKTLVAVGGEVGCGEGVGVGAAQGKDSDISVRAQ